jgi:phosphoribosylamine--glycine ligase
MNVLVVGSGGREHALCWGLAVSPLVDKLYCAPGNGGIGEDAECVDIRADDTGGLIAFARDREIGLVVIGPEGPLAAGLADSLEAEEIPTFGPSARAAVLEGSKSFTKDLCARHGIPTAAYGCFADRESAKAYCRELGAPLVVKADGLAAGKGVSMCATLEEADAACDSILGGAFGAAGNKIVVEEMLDGEEVSAFALVHGSQVLWLASAQDYKRAGDGDTGSNTGGMGAVSPAPLMTDELREKITKQILMPTARAMADERRLYSGVLYAGLMIVGGEPVLLEYNVRFGDPECQAILPRLKTDLVTMLLAAREGALNRIAVRWSDEVALTVVLAANGYPGTPATGSEIRGIDTAEEDEDVVVFHAGTQLRGGATFAIGGRVLAVTALGTDATEAQERAYAAVDRIDWPEGFCRRDIGWRSVGR